MKITKSTLKQIIKEEVVKLLTENEDQENAIKILNLLEHEDPDYFAQGVQFYSLFKEDIEANAPTENDQILEKLRVIDRFESSDIEDVDFLSGLSELNVTEQIDLRMCSSLENVDGLEGLTSLTTLNLYWCSKLQNVDGLKGLTSLTTLNLIDCESLKNVNGLQGLTNLTVLNLSWCDSLPPELQRWFRTDSSGTAYEQFIKALNASKTSQP